MPAMASETTLQNLVAELAETTPEDVAAVLAMLDAASAAKVRTLLAAHLRGKLPEADVPARPFDTAGLSDWLAARVIGRPADDLDTCRMTAHAIDTLRTLSAAAPRQAGAGIRR